MRNERLRFPDFLVNFHQDFSFFLIQGKLFKYHNKNVFSLFPVMVLGCLYTKRFELIFLVYNCFFIVLVAI